jgi:hypothetical protein
MSIVDSGTRVAQHSSVPLPAAKRRKLPPPPQRVPPVRLVQLCYTLVHAAEAVGIRDLADGEYLPSDQSLESGIKRPRNKHLE